MININNIIEIIDKKNNLKFNKINGDCFSIVRNIKSGPRNVEFTIIINNKIIVKKRDFKVKFYCQECNKESIIGWHNKKFIIKNNSFLCTNCSRKKSILSKYGVTNVSKIKEVKEKKENTLNKNYGVRAVIHIDGMFDKVFGNRKFYRKKRFNEKLFYQSKLELKFIEYCIKNKIDIKNSITFRYNYKDKEHKYFPDFMIADEKIIVEMKSNHKWWRIEKELGIDKLKKESVIKNGYKFLLLFEKDMKMLDSGGISISEFTIQ